VPSANCDFGFEFRLLRLGIDGHSVKKLSKLEHATVTAAGITVLSHFFGKNANQLVAGKYTRRFWLGEIPPE
jgi:hypothetical protein